ncbi:MAG: SocA family protein, partial [Candidatus Altiarchaeales archaeon]|nr:SocA family protein [Candidatus Altiarchaeota archaeon]MCG2783300.1 SocA family protein [Candidatus Altiarchaeales archaeon]
MDSPTFNKEKFETVILYIIKKCGGLSNFGKTTLFKMLYFSDFNHYERYETYLTGEAYVKLKRGPAPRHFNEVIKSMEEEGKVSLCKVPFHTYLQQKFITQTEPNLDLLTGRELETIDNVIDE